MKRFSKILAALGIAYLGVLLESRVAQASIDLGVSPPFLEFEVGQQTQTRSLNVINFGKEAVKVRVSIFNWELDENNKVKLLPPTEQSLDQWILLNPLEFTIAPGTQQTLRLGIRPRVKPQEGEHRAIIYLETSPVKETSGSIHVRGRLGVAAYGYVGDRQRVGILNGVTVQTDSPVPTALFDITSTGKAHVRLEGQYAIWPSASFPGADKTEKIPDLDRSNAANKLPNPILDAGMVPNLPILPQTRRQIALPLMEKLPPGNYILDLNAHLGDSKINQGIPFVIPSSKSPSSK